MTSRGGQATILACRAVLFDLDGVLVDSTACVENTWRTWAARHRLNPVEITARAHGRRALETIRSALPNLTDDEARGEFRALIAYESTETKGIRKVPGAADLLENLPAGTWAIVTSGARAVAEHRLRCVGLTVPAVMVCADEVSNGKPHPEGYLVAAARFGIEPAACLVVEDAPAGIAAARAANMRAVAVATTHRPDELADATVVAATLDAISIEATGDGALRVSVLSVDR